MGGVDLSLVFGRCHFVKAVPARVGGVDLSPGCNVRFRRRVVPARVGGVDLSLCVVVRAP